MLGINTNVGSLTAQRNLSGTTSAMSTTLQRLSSGLRINSAKDDAAGLGISQRMTSQIRGLDQARRNSNDGISLAQTAEGALTEVGNNLQRMRELTVQAANATNTGVDRDAIQSEINQLSAEIDRVAGTTAFNGQKLLDGSFSSASFQVGANANEVISFGVKGAKTSDLGSNRAVADTSLAAAAIGAANAAATNGNTTQSMTFNGVAVNVATAAGASAKDMAAAINAASQSTGVTATASTKATLAVTTAAVANPAAGVDNSTTFTLNGKSFTLSEAEASSASHKDVLIEKINGLSTDTGVVATLNASGSIDLVAADGRDIKMSSTTGAGATASMVTTLSGSNGAPVAVSALAAAVTTVSVGGQLKFNAADTVVINAFAGQNGTGAADATALGAASITTAKVSVKDVSVKDFTSATDALSVLDGALAMVAKQQSDLGAIQNRFSSTIANLQTTSENLSASRSRIMDTDFAAETANLSRNQVLQQAGTAMLAQANQAPQIALQLLR